MSSPARRWQIRQMRRLGVEKIVVAHEWDYDLEKMVPVYAWPRTLPKDIAKPAANPDAKDLKARLAREERNKKRKEVA